MKRLVAIVEGETEEAFVNKILSPYIWNKGYSIAIQCFKLKHSGGGVSKYSHIEKDILNTIHEKDVIVTTMFDFYGLPKDVPGFTDYEASKSHLEQVKHIENEIFQSISKKAKCSNTFIPYIQLHEIEALTFASDKGFKELFDDNEIDLSQIEQIIKDYPNPEDIDNGPDTAPSKRLKRAIPGYDKVLYGIGLIEVIGMEQILAKCPHFKEWIDKIEKEVSESFKK